MTYSNGLTPDLGISDHNATAPVSAPTRTPAVGRPGSPHAAALNEIATDSANVSAAGSLLSQAMTGSDVRLEKVAALRQSIDAGTYNIPSEAVASKLLNNLLR